MSVEGLADMLSMSYYKAVRGENKAQREEEYTKLLRVYMPLKDMQNSVDNIRTLSIREYHGDWSKALSGLKTSLDREMDKLDNIILQENERDMKNRKKPKEIMRVYKQP